MPWYPVEVYEKHYLASDDPYTQSGFRGDAARWESARRPICEAIDRPGTFLDVGCANGLLMESVAAWSPHRVEPYGLDFSPRLVELARRRLPHWTDRIFLGEVLEWEPPHEFDFVRTELVYVPEGRRRDLLARLFSYAGRLVVCSYGSLRSGKPVEPVGEILQSFDLEIAGELEHEGLEGALVRLAWLDQPGRLVSWKSPRGTIPERAHSSERLHSPGASAYQAGETFGCSCR